jgi:hypothetical protein
MNKDTDMNTDTATDRDIYIGYDTDIDDRHGHRHGHRQRHI